MTTPYQGGQALGEIIFGGREGGNSDAFLKRLRENYTTQRAMDEAASSQIQRIAREAITAADIEAARKGDMAAQARLGEAALRTADTPNLRNVTGGFNDFDAAGHKRAAVEKAGLGDMAGANAELFGLAKGPLKVNEIDSGYQLNPYEVDGEATPTATENAKIGELGARADVSRAKAAAGGFAPRAPRAGGAGAKRSAAASKQIVATLEKEMGRKLTAAEVDQVYAGGDFEFTDAPKASLGEAASGKAPAGVDQSAYAKALQRKADAIRAIERGAPKEKVAERLRSTGNAKLADWLLENY